MPDTQRAWLGPTLALERGDDQDDLPPKPTAGAELQRTLPVATGLPCGEPAFPVEPGELLQVAPGFVIVEPDDVKTKAQEHTGGKGIWTFTAVDLVAGCSQLLAEAKSHRSLVACGALLAELGVLQGKRRLLVLGDGAAWIRAWFAGLELPGQAMILCWLGDGAAWIRAWFAGLELPGQAMILCWWHLRKRCYESLRLAGGSKPRRQELERAVLGQLWQGRVDEAIDLIKGASASVSHPAAVATLIGYLEKRRAFLPDYQERQRAGLWIASTRVEKLSNASLTFCGQVHQSMSLKRALYDRSRETRLTNHSALVHSRRQAALVETIGFNFIVMDIWTVEGLGMRSRFLIPLVGSWFVWAGGLVGCSRSPAKVAPPEPVTIPVSLPVMREVTDYVEFTGRTNAIQAVDIRPRVTGYLVKIPFQEGADVKAGDLLFEIDPRPYQAQLDQATGLVNLYQAQLKLAKINYGRDRAINERVPGSVSPQQLDQDIVAEEEADARVKSYENNRETYQLNLDFTQVKSPIDGHISRYYLTTGNLVNQDQTVLTTVVSQDPMFAYFDMDEPTLLQVRRAINEGRIKRPQPGEILPVFMGLQGEEGYPHQGSVNFVDNQVDPTTGSILVRGVFPNPQPATGVRLLSPGMFVRIRLPIGAPHQALLVIDRALGSDQGLKYVDVIDAQGEVEYRRVTTGPLQADGLRVISSGLKADDLVVVGGLQQIRPKMKVQMDKVSMPSLAAPDLTPSKAQNPPEAAPKSQPPSSGAAGKPQG